MQTLSLQLSKDEVWSCFKWHQNNKLNLAIVWLSGLRLGQKASAEDGLWRGCQVGIGPSLQFDEAQRKAGQCPRSALVVQSSCYQLPSTSSAAPCSLETAQHRLLEGQSMFSQFVVLVIGNLPGLAQDVCMDPVRKGSTYFLLRCFWYTLVMQSMAETTATQRIWSNTLLCMSYFNWS